MQPNDLAPCVAGVSSAKRPGLMPVPAGLAVGQSCRSTTRCAPQSVGTHRGFTLIEVLIVVAIIGILAAIAYPSYSEQMIKNRRSEAIAFLAHAAAEQQRYFSDNTQYATTLTQLGFGDSTTTEEGYYTISVTNVDAGNAASEVHFKLTATPVAGGPQANDATCGTLSINERGTKGETGSGSVQDCW